MFTEFLSAQVGHSGTREFGEQTNQSEDIDSQILNFGLEIMSLWFQNKNPNANPVGNFLFLLVNACLMLSESTQTNSLRVNRVSQLNCLNRMALISIVCSVGLHDSKWNCGME